jgi:hypothetical protein
MYNFPQKFLLFLVTRFEMKSVEENWTSYYRPSAIVSGTLHLDPKLLAWSGTKGSGSTSVYLFLCKKLKISLTWK